MNYVTGAKCVICGKIIPTEQIDYICPDHGNEGILDILYDYETIKKSFTREDLAANRDTSMWRYKPLLPVHQNSPVPNMPVGGTPLLKLDLLARELGIKNFYLKDDGRLPTASFKDRASAIALVKAREQKADIITTASTGNAAAALSGLSATMNQKNVIFVPASAPQAKIAQLLMFGSTVLLVEGTYDDAFDLCLEAAKEYGWYNRNTGFNPFMSEGKKTCSFEICEQLNWKAPDKVFVSVGDGCIIGGIHKGLSDLLQMGWIDRMPQIFGIQAEGSSYLYQAWKSGEDVLSKEAVEAETVADSISAGLPRDRIKALAAVKNTGGAFITVSDEEILKAIPDLAGKSGVFAEPAGAATWAGIKKAALTNQFSEHDTVAMINTGSGLKDIGSAMNAAKLVNTAGHHVKPDISDFKKIAGKLSL